MAEPHAHRTTEDTRDHVRDARHRDGSERAVDSQIDWLSRASAPIREGRTHEARAADHAVRYAWRDNPEYAASAERTREIREALRRSLLKPWAVRATCEHPGPLCYDGALSLVRGYCSARWSAALALRALEMGSR